MVYHLEIGLLFTALVFLGPLVGTVREARNPIMDSQPIGLADLPG